MSSIPEMHRCSSTISLPQEIILLMMIITIRQILSVWIPSRIHTRMSVVLIDSLQLNVQRTGHDQSKDLDAAETQSNGSD